MYFMNNWSVVCRLWWYNIGGSWDVGQSILETRRYFDTSSRGCQVRMIA